MSDLQTVAIVLTSVFMMLLFLSFTYLPVLIRSLFIIALATFTSIVILNHFGLLNFNIYFYTIPLVIFIALLSLLNKYYFGGYTLPYPAKYTVLQEYLVLVVCILTIINVLFTIT